jgi:hypothetical protein
MLTLVKSFHKNEGIAIKRALSFRVGGDDLQNTDQVDRGICRSGYWQRRDPFPPTKPNLAAQVSSLASDFQSSLIRPDVRTKFFVSCFELIFRLR